MDKYDAAKDKRDAENVLDQIRAWVRTVDAGLITACEGIDEIAAIMPAGVIYLGDPDDDIVGVSVLQTEKDTTNA